MSTFYKINPRDFPGREKGYTYGHYELNVYPIEHGFDLTIYYPDGGWIAFVADTCSCYFIRKMARKNKIFSSTKYVSTDAWYGNNGP